VRVVLLGTGVQPVPPTGYGGVERTLAEYAKALRAAGVEVAIIQEVRRGRSIDEYRFAWHLRSLLRNQSYNVLHASTPVVANRLHQLGRPFVYTTHSRHWFERHGLSQDWGFWLERRAVRRSVQTVALTPTVLQAIERQVGPSAASHISVIPIGVDLERFSPCLPAPDSSVALGVGVIERFKRWELAAASTRATGVKLRLIGPIRDRSYAEELRRDNPHLELLGERPEEELSAAYRESWFLIHPSRVELLPGVVLQALASGLPVIGSSPLSGIIVQGVTGWTTGMTDHPESTVRQMRGYVLALLADTELRRQMSLAARQSAERDYSWKTVVERHLELYRRLLASGALTPAQNPDR
jgi:glycosyltransferase involved in cell wall biosynthesis